jgi:protein-S-isoprenylcysteine O-methyltransferase Ste14
MTPFDMVVAAALAVLLPIPLYWLCVHPFAAFWRRRGANAAFLLVGVPVWIASLALLWFYHALLVDSAQATNRAVGSGGVLIAAAVMIFARARRDLGAARILGQTELTGGGELQAVGIYARLRHPIYLAQMMCMTGLCLLAGTSAVWTAAAAWLVLLLAAIQFEERELAARFGEPYREYRRQVPAFLPLGTWRGTK